jgi:hypothetical protein
LSVGLSFFVAQVFALDGLDQSLQTHAEQLFNQYCQYEQLYDNRLADLYDAQAVIQSVVRKPGQPVETKNLVGAQYQMMIRGLMPLAKLAGDRSTYEGVRYQAEKNRVRLFATRVDEKLQSRTPFQLLMGESASGRWVIFEEVSEIR